MRIKGALSPVAGRAAIEAHNAKTQAGSSNKFGAVPTTRQGVRHDSKHEAEWADTLRLLEQSGQIRDLKTDKGFLRWQLQVNHFFICDYTADFSFTAVTAVELNTVVGRQVLVPGWGYVGDAKSGPTRKKRDYSLVKKLMFAVHRIEILEL